MGTEYQPEELPTTSLLGPAAAKTDATHGEHQKASNEQPSLEALAALGIKVHDFIDNKTLSPIVPFRPRTTRPLRRRRPDGTTEEADFGYGFIMGVPRVDASAGPPRKLQRRATEAVLPLDEGGPWQAGRPLRREPAFFNLDGFGHGSPGESEGQPQDISQEDEPLIATPVVTPNGSLRWPDSPCAFAAV